MHRVRLSLRHAQGSELKNHCLHQHTRGCDDTPDEGRCGAAVEFYLDKEGYCESCALYELARAAAGVQEAARISR